LSTQVWQGLEIRLNRVRDGTYWTGLLRIRVMISPNNIKKIDDIIHNG
jgi:hypothetical protein